MQALAVSSGTQRTSASCCSSCTEAYARSCTSGPSVGPMHSSSSRRSSNCVTSPVTFIAPLARSLKAVARPPDATVRAESRLSNAMLSRACCVPPSALPGANELSWP
eukprot:2775370-Pleurochrysis_carterae.AAC.2